MTDQPRDLAREPTELQAKAALLELVSVGTDWAYAPQVQILKRYIASQSAELDAIKRTREQEEQYDGMCYELQRTREALAWIMRNGPPSFADAQGNIVIPPDHIRPILAKALEGKS